MRVSLLLTLFFVGTTVLADDVLEVEDLVRALTPSETEKPLTRSLQPARGIKVRVKSKVDMKIPFEYNSSDLAPEAETQLMKLVQALNQSGLASFRFEIAGHTDASGPASYNRELSEDRADSVREFLIANGVAANRLESIGLGEYELADPDRPNHADNRRVEIRNLGSSGDQ